MVSVIVYMFLLPVSSCMVHVEKFLITIRESCFDPKQFSYQVFFNMDCDDIATIIFCSTRSVKGVENWI